MARQGNDSAEKAAVVERFDQVAAVFEVFCPEGAIRLPSPREDTVMVEVDLDSFEAIMSMFLA